MKYKRTLLTLAVASTHARADFVTNALRITVKQVTAAKQVNP